VALYQRLALEGTKSLAELISACFPHAKNELGVRALETPHERCMVAEVLLQFRPLCGIRHDSSLALFGSDGNLCRQIPHR
jgi:hypothetical protein